MIVRPYHPDDAEAIPVLLRHVCPDDEDSMAFFRYGMSTPPGALGQKQTLVAESSGEIWGAASLWRSRIHPHTLYFGVVVHPDHQGQGIGGLLYDQLLDCRGPLDRLPLQTSLWETSDNGVRFLDRRGFELARRTISPVLRLADVDLSQLQDLCSKIEPVGYQIASRSDLLQDLDGDQKLSQLCGEIYRGAHGLNPPADLTQREWAEIVFREPLIDRCTAVALASGVYVATILAHPHEAPGSLWAGWCGVAQAHRRYDRELVLRLILHQIRCAQAAGYAYLQAEIDSTDPWASLLRHHLPFGAAPSWQTYRLGL